MSNIEPRAPSPEPRARAPEPRATSHEPRTTTTIHQPVVHFPMPALRAMRAVTVALVAIGCNGQDGPAMQTSSLGASRDWESARKRMVSDQMRARDIRDPRVLDVMGRVPRHLFVPED